MTGAADLDSRRDPGGWERALPETAPGDSGEDVENSGSVAGGEQERAEEVERETLVQDS